jgi:hypothetical protein
MKKWKNAVLMAAATVALPCSVHALPLLNLQLLGSSDGGLTYTSNLQVVQGQTYDFEVVGELAPVGTVNTHGTITSETPGFDGIGSTAYNLTNDPTNPLQINFVSATLQGTYATGNGSRPGTPTATGSGNKNDNALLSARPINPNGVNTAVGHQDVIETGTFTVTAAPASSTTTVVGSYDGTVISDIVINSSSTSLGNTVVMSGATETSSDPVQSIAPLTLTASASPVPEPASAALFAAGALGLLIRRRRPV